MPLYAVLSLGGVPLIYELARKAAHRQFGSDLLAGISIVTSVILGEYLAGSIVVLMLAGGEALESYALRTASSVLEALARRMPSIGHRRDGMQIVDVPLDAISIGDILLIHPHEICPIDGEVIEGHGKMDEAYLTGEPFEITKTRGSRVISGAINGEAALTVRATARAVDSRYAKIAEVMRESAETRPQLRRLGDQLGAIYTPLALAVAGLAWAATGSATRFLAVLVIATPCPLLIAIPVAIIGSISLCARRSIIVRSSVALEQITGCRTAIFDKTGTLTYGAPSLTDVFIAAGFARDEVMTLVASLERYSRHPLARAVLAAHQDERALPEATEVSEPPGAGLRGTVAGRQVTITSRSPSAVPRCTTRGQPSVRGTPPARTSFHPRDDCVGRSAIRGALPRGPRRRHRGACAADARRKARDRPVGNGARQDTLCRRRHQRRPGHDGGHGRCGDRSEQRRDERGG
jgi:cation transport ATPase